MPNQQGSKDQDLRTIDQDEQIVRSSRYSIFTGWKKIQVVNDLVRFMNTYRGMPVSYNGHILEANFGQVVFSVPQPQIVCMRKDRITYLKSRFLLSVVKAKVRSMDLENEIVNLVDFEYVEDNIGKRSFVRVETDEPLPADIIPSGSRPFPAMISEVSLRGLILTAWARAVNPRRVKKGTELFIKYNLPVFGEKKTHKTVMYEGVVRNIYQMPNREYRLGIQVSPDTEVERLVMRYIAKRQREVLKEIKNQCTR
jgi:hypothetical protein